MESRGIKQKLDSIFGDKRCIGILGMGREGISSYLLLRRYYPRKNIFLIDQKREFLERMPAGLADDSRVRALVGEKVFDFLLKDGDGSRRNAASSIDLFLKTPGISLKNYPSLLHDKRMSSQTEIFLTLFGQQCIGVTGTKGKSTTTNLIYHLLKHYKKAVMAGNMGIPLFDIVEEITPDTVVVCELSSHQLEFVHHSPRIGVLLNLYEEHLDHYVDYLAYQRAKMNIFAGRRDGSDVGIVAGSCNASADIAKGDSNVGSDIAIFNSDDPLIAQRFKEIEFNGIKLPFSADDNSIMQILLQAPCALTGVHNELNKKAAILAVRSLGLTDEQIKAGLSTFKPLPHRLEYIGEIDGIHFYNDSISTIPQATIAAIESVRSVYEVGSIILGGFDRGIDYTSLVDYLREKPVPAIAFTGEAGRRISRLLQESGVGDVETFQSDRYAEIIEWCKHYTPKGTACILSPAAASYDQFKNFEERGKVFTDLVLGK
jgi:UDP-N-acetylmuramoylalanine--D-glutamate ligase